MAEQGKGPVDTSHWYEGKVVRSSAPSRKKAAGTLKADSGIPDDAVPDVEIPNWIDAIFGGPVLVNREFVSPIWSVKTILFGETNSRLTSTGPPKMASIQFGISTSGTASSGIPESAFRVPAAFFLLGAEDLTTFPSYQ
jgi:hypothetical protein